MALRSVAQQIDALKNNKLPISQVQAILLRGGCKDSCYPSVLQDLNVEMFFEKAAANPRVEAEILKVGWRESPTDLLRLKISRNLRLPERVEDALRPSLNQRYKSETALADLRRLLYSPCIAVPLSCAKIFGLKSFISTTSRA